MDKQEAIDAIREATEEIYTQLGYITDVLLEVAPGELDRAHAYWMAHIDGALENRQGVLGGSFVSLEDTIRTIEGTEDEEG